MQQMNLRLGGVTVAVSPRFSDTVRFFSGFIGQEPTVNEVPIAISDDDWAYFLQTGMLNTAYTEYSVLAACCSDQLLWADRVVAHAAALRWQEKAYLIMGLSGVGKSTQTRFLQELRPNEFGIICGDRPILEFRHCETSPQTCRGNPSSPDSSILVHPSPWNGKENWHDAEAAPLAGVILLERGEENRLVMLTTREAGPQLYPFFIQTAFRKEEIQKVAELETILLNRTPAWKLTSKEVPDSTRLLLDTVFPR